MSFCSSCGSSVPSGSSFCSGCGKSISSAVVPLGGGVGAQPAKSETKFLELGDVLVTNSRFVKGKQTFAMSGITSVSKSTEEPPRKGPIVLALIGAVVLIGGFNGSMGAVLIGVVMIVLGVLWYRSIKDIHHVKITSASTEKKAMQDVDEALIDQIVGAINEAIIHRG